MSGRNQTISYISVLVGCGQFCFSSNQVAGVFDYQYLWKESIDILDFVLEDNHQGKEAFGTTTFGWMWPVVPHIQSNCRILSSAIYVEEIQQSLRFCT